MDVSASKGEIAAMLYYFAYGSNLHPIRLLERVSSAKLIGLTSINSHRLVFHKRSHDGSGKCNILETDRATDIVHGAIYTIAPEHKCDLDRYEGKGSGYIDSHIKLRCHDQEYLCFTYLAQRSYISDDLKPYHWYKEMVVLGANYHGFSDIYISAIASIASTEDPDQSRRLENETLLDKMRYFSRQSTN